jgi:hypothetical protein
MMLCYADGFHLSNTFKVRVRVWLIAPSQSNSWALTSFVDDVGQALDLDDSGVLTNDEIDNITPFLSAPVPPPPPSSHSTTPESSIHLVLKPYIVVSLYSSSTSIANMLTTTILVGDGNRKITRDTDASG